MIDVLLKTIDHLVYAAPDLETAVAQLEARLGVRAAYGGRHPGRGTRNALIALSEFSYLEIVAPDQTQHDVIRPRWFSMDVLTGPRLVTWAVKSANVEQIATEAARGGVALGRVASGSRQSTDGTLLRWRFTDPAAMVEDGMVPFFIDWGSSPHPAASAPRGPAMLSLRAEHPNPERLERALATVGLVMSIVRASEPGLIATLRTSRGDVELR